MTDSPAFDALLTGNYVVQLIVNDGLLDSSPDTVVISVSDSNTQIQLVSQFIQRLYQNILGRSADAAGLAYWNNKIQTTSATWTALGFFNSAEFLSLGLTDDAFVRMLYLTLFDRKADAGGYDHWINKLQQGALRDMVFYGFFLSQEFRDLADRFGVVAYSGSDKALFQLKSFVQRFYPLVLNRQADSAGFNYWLGKLTSGKLSGGELATGFFLSSEFTSRNLDNNEFINIVYQVFFDRKADAAGKTYWLKQMANGLSRISVINGFIHSQEFFNLASRFGIKP